MTTETACLLVRCGPKYWDLSRICFFLIFSPPSYSLFLLNHPFTSLSVSTFLSLILSVLLLHPYLLLSHPYLLLPQSVLHPFFPISLLFLPLPCLFLFLSISASIPSFLLCFTLPCLCLHPFLSISTSLLSLCFALFLPFFSASASVLPSLSLPHPVCFILLSSLSLSLILAQSVSSPFMLPPLFSFPFAYFQLSNPLPLSTFHFPVSSSFLFLFPSSSMPW